MYLLQQTVPVEGVPALVAGVGYVGQIATDPDTDDVYVNFGGQWTKLVDGNGEPVQMTVTSAQISDASAVGRSVLTATDAAAARTAIEAQSSAWQPGPNDLSVAQPVKNFLGAADFAGMQSQMGGTTTGKLLFTAATPADALAAIEGIGWGDPPTNTKRGGVFQQAAIADVSAAPTQADFNGLLAKLRSSGLLASS